MQEKFGVRFELFSREKQEQCVSGNYFDEQNQLIVRLDQLSRNEDYQALLKTTQWDLIIVDEAHKLSASYYGNEIKKTGRFKLGELLGTLTRHFLLMTATPHNGKEEDFQLFLSLLDGDRFYGKFRNGARLWRGEHKLRLGRIAGEGGMMGCQPAQFYPRGKICFDRGPALWNALLDMAGGAR